MRKVLIAGQHSFIGTAVERRLAAFSGEYAVETLDMHGEGWKAFDFSPFDSVVHVAGIAHVSPKPEMRPLYEAVNRDLAVACARRALETGVSQFIYLSSAIVFGDAAPAGGKRRDHAGDVALALGRLWPQQAGGRARPARAGKRALPRRHPAADDGLWPGLQGQLQRPFRPRAARAAVPGLSQPARRGLHRRSGRAHPPPDRRRRGRRVPPADVHRLHGGHRPRRGRGARAACGLYPACWTH